MNKELRIHIAINAAKVAYEMISGIAMEEAKRSNTDDDDGCAFSVAAWEASNSALEELAKLRTQLLKDALKGKNKNM